MNIDQLERDLTKRRDDAAALLAKTAKECQAHETKDADGKVTVTGRLMTDAEREAIQTIINDANAIKARINSAKGDAALSAEIDRLTAGMTKRDADETRRVVRKSLGQQWSESDAGRFFAEKKHHGTRNWASPAVELFDPAVGMFSTTLTEGAGSGGALVVPDYRPGVVPLLFKPLTVRDLISPGTTTSNAIVYMQETTFTNAAAAVAEGAAKPESALVFAQVTDLVSKIAHWLPVTEEMLEDVPQISSYIDARLRLGVDLTIEDQLLNGNGTAPNLRGILNRAGLTAPVARVDPATNADVMYQAMMKVFNASFVMPDGHVMNPANWQTTALAKDTTGRYIGGGPFAATVVPTLWGLPVAVTPSIVANTGLTGAFRTQSQVFARGGMRVEASNSHQDFFVKNLVAIRAEERLALCVYRPAAFGTATGLN
jgi:HK97 family phage major capsid protein